MLEVSQRATKAKKGNPQVNNFDAFTFLFFFYASFEPTTLPMGSADTWDGTTAWMDAAGIRCVDPAICHRYADHVYCLL